MLYSFFDKGGRILPGGGVEYTSGDVWHEEWRRNLRIITSDCPDDLFAQYKERHNMEDSLLYHRFANFVPEIAEELGLRTE